MDGEDSGIGILKKRYANGEITRKQYLEMRKNLGTEGGDDATAHHSQTKAGGKAAPGPAPAKQHQISALTFAIVVVLIILVASIVFSGLRGAPVGATTTAATTIYAQPLSELLFTQNYTVQLTKGSPQCGPPACVRGIIENFTVPANSSGADLTGSYSSQNATVVAVLTPAQLAIFMRVNESSIFSNNEYYVYNRSANVDVRLAPGNYSIVLFYPGNSSDKVVMTRPMALSYSAAPAQSQTLAAPSITPLNSTIRQGQSVTFSSTWSGGAYHNYEALLYSNGALPCNRNGLLVQSAGNLSSGDSLSNGEATFSPVIPAASTYYCIYVVSGYGTAAPEIANSATSYIQISQSAGTTTVRPTTTVSGGGGGGGPSYYCGAGYVLGSYGDCDPACGGGYCTNGKVCQAGECVTATTQGCPYGDVLSADGYCIPPCTPGSCPDGQVCQSDGECIQPGCDYGYVLGSDGHCDVLCGPPGGEYCIGSGICDQNNLCGPACDPGYHVTGYGPDGAEGCASNT
jgi:hypothetical protein